MSSADSPWESYEWADDWYDSVGQAYCLTLASGLTPAEFLARINAEPAGASEGTGDLAARSRQSGEAGPVTQAVIGVTEVRDADGGPWTLGVEINGSLGVTEEVIAALFAGTAAGTTVVSHFASASTERFSWMEDGKVALAFDPLFPQDREGTQARAVKAKLRAAGFDLADDAENMDHPTASAFALAEQITKVTITRDYLESATYELGIARYPGQ